MRIFRLTMNSNNCSPMSESMSSSTGNRSRKSSKPFNIKSSRTSRRSSLNNSMQNESKVRCFKPRSNVKKNQNRLFERSWSCLLQPQCLVEFFLLDFVQPCYEDFHESISRDFHLKIIEEIQSFNRKFIYCHAQLLDEFQLHRLLPTPETNNGQ